MWLLVFIAAGAVTVRVLAAFESTVQAAVTLTFFVPLVIGTAGSTGAQSATTITRAMAVGELRLDDLRGVVVREGATGLLLGAVLGLLAFGPIAVLVEPKIATIVSLTLGVACTFSAFIGSALPLLARRVGLDPAVMSVPLISAIIDGSGLLAYFLIAGAILGL